MTEPRAHLGARDRRGGNATRDGVLRWCTTVVSIPGGSELCGAPASHRVACTIDGDLWDLPTWACAEHTEALRALAPPDDRTRLELTPVSWL